LIKLGYICYYVDCSLMAGYLTPSYIASLGAIVNWACWKQNVLSAWPTET